MAFVLLVQQIDSLVNVAEQEALTWADVYLEFHHKTHVECKLHPATGSEWRYKHDGRRTTGAKLKI